MTRWSQSKYVIFGATLGFLFPIIGILTDLVYEGSAISLGSIFQLYTRGPLHWIILTAPIVLGVVFFFMHRVVFSRELVLLNDKKNNDELLSKLKDFLIAIEQGNLSSARHEFGNPLLNELSASLKDRLKKQRDADEKAKWIAEGHAKFGEILRLTSDLKTLSEVIIKNIVKYVNLNQGSVFILEAGGSNEDYLSLNACYAYERKKYLTKSVQLGEGLVGQCFLENQTIILKKVPEDYIKITSGLGGARPSFVLVVPVKSNGRSEGVMELAGFKALETFQIEFIEKVCEAFASVIRTVKVSQETKHLLQETQNQTEQLRSQEEEIRQNMEEMQVTQEQLSRQLEESKILQQRVERREHVMALTTILSETDLAGTITYVNDKFCEVAKYRRDELLGKSQNIVRHPDMPKDLFKTFWSTIKRGEVFKGIVKNRSQDGTHYWVDATIVPIKNDKGEVIKYVGARYHIKDDDLAVALYNRQADQFGWTKL